MYKTGRSQSDGMLLEVLHFTSVCKSKKHFGLSLHMNPQGFGMICPMMYTQQNPSLHSEIVENLSLCKSGANPCNVSGLINMDLCFLM